MNKHSRFERTSTSTTPDYNLFERAKEKGSAYIDLLSDQEQLQVLGQYREALDSLDEQDKADFLEEFLSHHLIDDSEAVQYIAQLDPTSKKQIGLFIGRTTIPGTYVQSFYECWTHLPKLEQQTFLSEFLASNNLDHLLMVAPFTPFNKDTLKKHFASIQDGSLLLEPLLLFAKRHPEVLQPHLVTMTQYRFIHTSNEPSQIKQTLTTLVEVNPSCAFIQLEELRDLEIISEDVYKSYYDEYDSPLLRTYIKLPREAREAIDEIGKRVKTVYGHDLSQHSAIYYHQLDELYPRSLAMEGMRIKDDAIAEESKRLLTAVKSRSAQFEDLDSFIQRLAEEQGINIVEHLELLEYDKAELFDFLRRTARYGMPFYRADLHDLRDVLAFNRRHEGEPDLEAFIVDKILQDLQEYNEIVHRYLATLVINLDSALTWFTPEHGAEIVSAITDNHPTLWVKNLSYASSLDTVDVAQLVGDAGKHSIESYYEVRAGLYATVRDHRERQRLLAILNESVKQHFIDQPDILLQHKELSAELFTAEEFDDLIAEAIARPHCEELMSTILLENPHNTYRQAIIKKFRNDPQLLIALNGTRGLEWEKLTHTIFSTDEYVAFMVENAAEVEWHGAEYYVTFWTHLTVDQLEDVLEKVIASRQYDSIGQLFNGCKVCESSIESRHQKWKQELATLTKNKANATPEQLERLQKLQHQDPPKLAEETKSHFTELREHIKLRLLEACKTSPQLAFSDKALDILGPSVHPTLREHFDTICHSYPETLLITQAVATSRLERRPLALRRIVGEERFDNMILHHGHYLLNIRASGRMGAFKYDDYPNKTVVKWFLAHDSLAPLNNKEDRYDKDLHDVLIDGIRDSVFFPYYQETLKTISNTNQEYGIQKKVSSFYPEESFTAPLQQAATLSTLPLRPDHFAAIDGLSDSKRQQLFDILELGIIRHSFDRIDWEDEALTIADLQRMVETEITESLPKELGIDTDVIRAADRPIDPTTARALMQYHNTTIRKHPAMAGILQTAVTEELQGNFESWRAWANQNGEYDETSHEEQFADLQAAKLIPSNMTLEQYTAWSDSSAEAIDTILRYDVDITRDSITTIIKQAAADHHIEPELLAKKWPQLTSERHELIGPLTELTAEQQLLKEKIAHNKDLPVGERLTPDERARYDELKGEIIETRRGIEKELQRLDALQYLDRLQKLSFKELEQAELKVDKKIVPFSKVFTTLSKAFVSEPEFQNDCTRIRDVIETARSSLFGGEAVSQTTLTVTDEIDMSTLTLIGEKPVASCQSYRGDSNFNVGLLSYITDPHTKVIQVRDDENRLISRAVVRLLATSDDAAALFVERVYSVNGHPQIAIAIREFAAKKAAELGVAVYSNDLPTQPNTPIEPAVLHNNASRSRYIYTDAAGGKKKNGRFIISTQRVA